MTRSRNILFSLCCLLALCTLLAAQESTPPQLAPSEEATAKLGPHNKAFLESLTKFRDINKNLTAMKVEYQDAKPQRQKEIDAIYSGIYDQGLELKKRLIEIALDAHAEAPNRNPLVIDLLYSAISVEFNHENYEESLRLFRRIEASGLEKNFARHYVFGGLAALLTMNYDEAEAWLKKATDSGELEKTFKSLAKSKEGMQFVMTLQNQMQMMPRLKEAWAKEQEIRKTEAKAGEQDPAKKLPRVEIMTTKGKIVLELFENEAPNTVANFISLVEKGFYNNTAFCRVLPAFMAQGGDPTGTRQGGPGYEFDDECGRKFPQARKHFRGSISMANGGPNTNGSQFFLTFIPTVHLDGKHTVFGRVAEGIEVLANIQRYDPDDNEATIPELDKIIEAKVLNKRDHAYAVKKNANKR